MLQIAELLVEDSIVIIEGRLELKDDEAAKISLDSIEIAPSQEDVKLGKIAAPPPPDYTPITRDIPVAIDYSESEKQKSEILQEQKQIAPVQKKSSTRGLFLRIPSESSPLLLQVMEMITEYTGPTTVHFYYTDTKKYNLNTGIKTSVTATLYGKLQNLLGNSNVVLKN